MVNSTYKKQRVLFFASRGLKAPAIAKQKENLKFSRVEIHKYLKKHEATGSISGRVGSGRPSKVMAEIKEIVEEQMRADDRLLNEKSYSISLRTILQWRTALRWTFLRKRLLPAHLRSEQSQATNVGTATPQRYLQQCYLDR